jgi:hypothetical protein
MSMGSYEGMPAGSAPRSKPLEHLVTAFLQAVMRVQNKQQQVGFGEASQSGWFTPVSSVICCCSLSASGLQRHACHQATRVCSDISAAQGSCQKVVSGSLARRMM